MDTKVEEYKKNHPTKKRSTLVTEAANSIVEYIEETGAKVGDQLPGEYTLAEMFGVGRGTVREAIKTLVSKNILEIIPAKGTFVADGESGVDPLGLENVEDKVQMTKDLFEIRQLLECYSVRKACENATEEQIRKMESYLKVIDENLDNGKVCVDYDIKFHKYLAQSCGNTVMPLVVPIIHSNMLHFNRMELNRDWKRINEDHYAILRAIEQRNPMLGEAEMVKHLNYVTENLDKMSEQ